MFFTGNTIIIDHGLGLLSIFAHLKDIYVNEKDLVSQGDKIGTIGMTGRATGPHLHWGVYLENTSVDPEVLLNFKLFLTLIVLSIIFKSLFAFIDFQI